MLYDPKWEVPAEAKPLEPWQLLLLEAAEMIERYGHLKCRIGNTAEGFCVVGALSEARDDRNMDYTMAVKKLQQFLKIGNGWTAHIDWNNARERTGAEVIAALRGAATLRGD